MELVHAPGKSTRHLRHLQDPYVHNRKSTSSRDLARNYVAHMATNYKISGFALALDKLPCDTITDDSTEIRFAEAKSLMQTDTVSFVQTHFGLPIWQAGISVSVQMNPLRVTSSQSTVHRSVHVQRPADGAKYLTTAITRDVFADLLGVQVDILSDIVEEAEESPKLRIFRCARSDRFAKSMGESRTLDSALNANPPTMPLKEIPDEIQDGMHYVVREVLFTTTPRNSHSVNWRAFVEVETGTILYLRSLAAAFRGNVFKIDQATAAGTTGIARGLGAGAPNNPIQPVELLGIRPSGPGEPQLLKGEYVELVDLVLPHPAATTTSAPQTFIFDPQTDPNDFSAVSAYYHCDDAFRMIENLGFNMDEYFKGTTFPVMVDAHAKVPSKHDTCAYGDCVDASTIATKGGNGVQAFLFARIGLHQEISLATDKRAVLHEFGHALLLNLIGSPTLGFAHNGGDSLAAIRCDPESDLQGDERFDTFPRVESNDRRHDRDVTEGWSWGGAHDDQNYESEQILSTTLFRAYRAAGGDAEDNDPQVQVTRRKFASDYLIYLMVRAMGSLPPYSTTPVLTPDIFETYLRQADIEEPDVKGYPHEHPSGGFHKVISWAFEKQGLVPENGTEDAKTKEGVPNVDVYIDDGRHGEYAYQENFWSSRDIWNRLQPDGDTKDEHETPIKDKTNYAYVRVKNRGANAATGVELSAYHTASAAGLVWGAGWNQMKPAPDTAGIRFEPGSSEIVGPFEWTPSEENETLLATVTAPDDRSNVDPTVRYAHRNGPTPLWQLVPFDNNLALRNIELLHGVTEPRSLLSAFNGHTFRVTNPHSDKVQIVQIDSKLPDFLETRGWSVQLPNADTQFNLDPGDSHDVTVDLQAGQDFSAADMKESGANPAIELRVLIDNHVVGGVTYEIIPA